MQPENQPKSQPSSAVVKKKRPPMTPEQLEAARQRAANMRAVRGTTAVKPKPEESATPEGPTLYSLKVTERTLGRLDCLLKAPDFTFKDYDDLLAWLIRQAAQANRTAAFHLNMRYQREREQIPKIL